VFQPYQFRRAEHLCWAIERRLQIARLQWVAMATELTMGWHGDYVVKVLVKRICHSSTGDSAAANEDGA